MMQILNSRTINQLIGKKIAFFHTGKFAEYITIATEDGCVAVISQVFIESDLDYRTETDVLSETLALHYIENQQYIR